MSNSLPPAVILAGGKGTRLGSLTQTLPKPLVPINGKPVLFYQLEWLVRSGIRQVFILAGYLGKQIDIACGHGERWGLDVIVLHEASPLGTAGALHMLSDRIDGPFLLVSGDVMVEFDVARLLRWHRERSQAKVTVVVHPNGHMFDSDLVEMDSHDRVMRLCTRPHDPQQWYHNQSIASAYIFETSVLKYLHPNQFEDIEKHLFPRLLAAGEAIYAYSTPEYLKDMGTPARLEVVSAHQRSGWIMRASLAHPRAAVFLDRDGVLNYEIDELCSADQLSLLPGAAEGLRLLNASGWLTVLVTNQPMLAKGTLSESGLDEIHRKLQTLLGKSGAWLDGIYWCPHHPELGFAGERPELKKVCACRKPGTGMILAAQARFGLDLSRSYLVGDTTSDAAAAEAAGVKFIGVETGYACRDGRYPLRAEWRQVPDLLAAAKQIIHDGGNWVEGTFS